MALKKTHFEEAAEEEKFDSLSEAVEYFYNSDNYEDKNSAITQMITFEDGAKKLVETLKDEDDHKILDAIGVIIAGMETENAPIDDILEILKSEDAYKRNLAIMILRDYGSIIKYYIVKYLIGDDRDLRIFAINILGDVEFSESREMMLELLESEEDVNVAMTAVDYLAEIGEEEDVPLLEELKNRFKDEFYVSFAVDNAINAIKG